PQSVLSPPLVMAGGPLHEPPVQGSLAMAQDGRVCICAGARLPGHEPVSDDLPRFLTSHRTADICRTGYRHYHLSGTILYAECRISGARWSGSRSIHYASRAKTDTNAPAPRRGQPIASHWFASNSSRNAASTTIHSRPRAGHLRFCAGV